jgi:DNA-binding response OmpR family regulator
MVKPVVFLVEDNELVSRTIAMGLTEEGYTLAAAANVREAMDKLAQAKPDIILLDLVLPDGNGLNLIKAFREHTDVPVIIISGKNDMVDKIVGLEMGADDYVGKPVQMKEIAARVKAQLRRYKVMTDKSFPNMAIKRKDAERIRFGAWILDRPRLQAIDSHGVSANLSVKEFRLIEALVMEPDRVLSREQLLDRVQAGNHDVTDRAIDVQILRIRRKIGDSSGPHEMIHAVRGIGYMFVAETEILPSSGQ